MDSGALRAAYAEFHRVAESGPFNAPANPEKWTAELITAHMVAIDHLLAATLSEVLAGRAPSHDNRPAIRTAHLGAIVGAAGDRPGLVALARHSAAVVCALVHEVGAEAANRPIPVFLQSGEAVVFDDSIPVAALLDAQTRLHLPGHTRQLQALKSG